MVEDKFEKPLLNHKKTIPSHQLEGPMACGVSLFWVLWVFLKIVDPRWFPVGFLKKPSKKGAHFGEAPVFRQTKLEAKSESALFWCTQELGQVFNVAC